MRRDGRTDVLTDMTKLIAAFRISVKAREKAFVPFLKTTFFSLIEIKILEVYPQFKHNAMNT
jgi:hypothetical protein